MRFFVILFVAAALTACSSTNVKIYEAEKPKLALETYFNSKMKGHGLVMNRSGEVTRRFVVQMNPHWTGQVGTFTEDFDWADGEKSQRIWTVTKTSENSYEGAAGDVIGKAVGEISGNAFHWNYKMDLKTKESHYNVDFEDWMFLVDENVLINEATMFWHGFRAGKILISFDKNNK